MLAATWAELSKVWSRERFSDMRLSRKLATKREQQGDDDAQQQDVAYLVVDRRAGVRMVLHEDPNLATWILPVVYHIFQGASMNDRESEGKNNGKNRKTFNSMEAFF